MSFRDIKGQDRQISFLKETIASNTVAHAYLFVGTDGIGKGLVATTFAKALNCQKEQLDPCDVCISCRKIDNKNHPDVFRIIPDEIHNVIKIGTIRTITQRISLKPYEAKWKIFIIEDAHLMTEEAANALLKTLEEPSPGSLLLLTTSNIKALFQTIISRCQIVKFSPLSPEMIENILIKKFGFQKDMARFISRLSGGGINKKAIAEGEGFITWKNKIIDEFMAGSFFQESSLFFSSQKKDIQEMLLVLINWYRDILIYPRCSRSRSENSIINFDRLNDIDHLSKVLSYEEIDNRLNALIDARLAINQNVNPKLAIGTLI